jgi:diguanylate cyclase
MKDMQDVAELLIEVLKELSAARQPLTPQSLGKSLASRKEFADRFSSDPQARPSKDPEAVSAQEVKQKEQIQELRSQLRNLRDQQQRLQRQNASKSDEGSRRYELYRKSALTLLVLARNADGQTLAPFLDQLRSLILEEGDPGLLEEILGKIRNVVMKETADDTLAPEKGEWQAETALKPQAEAPPNEAFIEQVRRAFLKILGRFHSVAGGEQRARCAELDQRIRSAVDIDALIAVGDDLAGLIEAYVGRAIEVQNRVASFTKELGRSLLQMEKQVLASFDDARDTFESNEVFNRTLQGDMSQIEDSFGQDSNDEHSRSFVLSKLSAIRDAIETKSKQDEARFRSSREKMEGLQKNLTEMKGEIDTMQERTKALEQEAQVDALTGVHNRRAWEKRIHEETERFHRYNQVFSLILFDVDHFKGINDEYGHRAGDKCLKEIANRVQAGIRKTDFLARYGGEEFAVILPGVGLENAGKAAEKIRAIVERTRFRYQGRDIRVTISLGVTEVHSNDGEPGLLFNRVDAAMYQAKKEGRNRVCVRESEK